nr:hypothetical protein [Rhodobacter sp.]
GNYDVGAVKWSEIKPSNEKVAEPTTLDELEAIDPAQAKALRKVYTQLEKDIAADDKAAVSKRAKSMAMAAHVVDIREEFADKKAWGRFMKFATETIADYMGKNGISEHYKAGLIAAEAGDGLDATIGARVTGAKGVCTAYANTLKAVGGLVAEMIDGTKTGLDAAAKTALGKMLSEGSNALSETEMAMARVVVPVHVSAWGDYQGITLDDNGAAVPAKTEDGKEYNVPACFGLEGGDELIRALCAGVNQRNADKIAAAAKEQAEADADTVEDVVSDMVADTESEGAFSGWSPELVAQHLAKIAFARIDAEQVDADREEVASTIMEDFARMVNGLVEGSLDPVTVQPV